MGSSRSSAHSHSLTQLQSHEQQTQTGSLQGFSLDWMRFPNGQGKVLRAGNKEHPRQSAQARGPATLTMFFIVKSTRSSPYSYFNDEKYR
ncbi:hypothetical protein J2Z66_005662 [Paenibacillus eucommiae]|uniref:Uncharacterized protein n=1 Tax=Paenibacillus eucommiae TaxID=1355755 RepID=A0ABS4J480_9BACL|nr:hypothetical protein [Paenibacillus eucommiae]